MVYGWRLDINNLLQGFEPAPVKPLYIFVDEYGNFDFSPSGTPYLILTALSCQRPFWWYPRVPSLRHDLIEANPNTALELFHASEDDWKTRNGLYGLISQYLDQFRVDSIIIEKRKAHPVVQKDSRFYPDHLGTLLKYVIKGWSYLHILPETIVITDRIPHKSKRSAVEKAIKTTLTKQLLGTRYRIYHFESRAEVGLQIADYCCWAIQRKWVLHDNAKYNEIKKSVKSEFDVFRNRTTLYY